MTEDDNNIVIREWKNEDAKDVIEIINHTWWEGSMSDRSTHLISTAFLRECLMDQTFIRVAERNGKILGVIMGCDRRNHHATFTERLQYWLSALSIIMDSEARALTNEGESEEELHRKLLEMGGNRNYDAEVTFFIVSEEARGLGIGGKLFGALEEYFRSIHVKSWYVFTDTDCSYEFYEHKGAVRRSEIYQEYTLPSGEKGDITWFLYDHGEE